MDVNVIIDFMGEFEELRIQRIDRAQDFLSDTHSLAEILADFANIAALTYAGLKIAQQPKGFQSDTQ